MTHELALSPAGTGKPVALERGDLRWRMAVPATGKLPFDGCFPALISWQGTLHPAQLLPDRAVRLMRMEIAHPLANELSALLSGRLSDPRIIFVPGATKALLATFSTPHGPRILR